MIIILAAMTKQSQVIGKDYRLPWDIPEELALFRKLTKDSTIIMGRRTYKAMGKPLSQRQNIVVSRSTFSIPLLKSVLM